VDFVALLHHLHHLYQPQAVSCCTSDVNEYLLIRDKDKASTTSAKASTTLATLLTKTPATSCASVTSVAITFNELEITTYGQTIKLAGSISQLGSWNTANAVALSAAKYTSSNPLWFVTLQLAPGTVFQYKFINVASSGTVTYEADPNHTYTVPSCTATVTINNTWQT